MFIELVSGLAINPKETHLVHHGQLTNDVGQEDAQIQAEHAPVVASVMSTEQESKLVKKGYDYRRMGKTVRNLRVGVYCSPSSSCSQRVRPAYSP